MASFLRSSFYPVAHFIPAIIVDPVVCRVQIGENNLFSVSSHLPIQKRIFPFRVSLAVYVLHVVDVYAEQTAPFAVALLYFITHVGALSRLGSDQDHSDRGPGQLIVNPFFDRSCALLLYFFPRGCIPETCRFSVLVTQLLRTWPARQTSRS
jgi:hypothetical protein